MRAVGLWGAVVLFVVGGVVLRVGVEEIRRKYKL